jgi:hypothetical protein
MGGQDDLRPILRKRANEVLSGLVPSEREALLIKCWMSHDARWFMAVAREFGMDTANRLNRIAANEVGKVEARRIVRLLGLPKARTVDDWLLTQEILLNLLGPDLTEYQLTKVGSDALQVRVQRCFANENAMRAGIIDHYQCGIFARITGWLDAQGLAYETSPPLGKCLKAAGDECLYRITLRFDGASRDQDNGQAEAPPLSAQGEG